LCQVVAVNMIYN